jgi:hypothetical protein
MLAQCEADARRIAGEGVGLRLAEWRRYENNPAALVVFVQQKIHRRKTYGGLIEAGGGMSLERVVVNLPELFTTHDFYTAKRVLGITP